MLCSASELGLAESAEGLLELPEDSPLGEDLRRLLWLDDRIIDIDLTPNRGDCLGMAGVAREVGVLNRSEVSFITADPVAATIDAVLPVKLSAPADCPRYVGRIIREIDPNARTPLWLQERLRRAGLRPISPLVDVTNYVMLELGQPMHAFDLHRLAGGIEVRRAQAGEMLELLNGNQVEPDTETLLIADQRGPLAIAGIMGGVASAVDGRTRDVFLESAFFTPTVIAGRARRYGLSTDSSIDSSGAWTRSYRYGRWNGRPGCCWTLPAVDPDRLSKRWRLSICRRNRRSSSVPNASAGCSAWRSKTNRSSKS